jgi:hypothetical protein
MAAAYALYNGFANLVCAPPWFRCTEQAIHSISTAAFLKSSGIGHFSTIADTPRHHSPPLFQKAQEVVGVLRNTHHVLEMGELIHVLADVRIKRFAVREDEGDVHQFLIRAGLEEAVHRSASQQMDKVLPLPAEWSARYFLPMSPAVTKWTVTSSATRRTKRL